MDRLLEATYAAEQRHFWFHGFRRFVAPLLRLATKGRRDLRLLDCGCGTGANLAILQRYGQAIGFDLTWTGLEFARRSGRRLVAQASITDIPCRSAAFDVVTSFDVLQTLTADQERAAMAEMFRVLAPGGALILNVAALEVLRGNHSILAAEVRRYRRRVLRAALERAGFDVVRLTYTNASIFPLMLAVRTAQRAGGLPAPEEEGRDIAVPARPINMVLSALLSVEALLLRRFDMPVGSSILALATKPLV
jgi:ubiquinone/menaquinone biosynthesis C-methylase UbiE